MIQENNNETVKQIKKKEIAYKKYYIDFNAPVNNKLVSLEAPIKYLNQNIKVNGLKEKLGEHVKVSAADKKDKQKNTIVVQSDTRIKFSKRYIKYLIKKFLKKQGMSLYLRVISQGSANYVVKLFNRDSE